MFEWALRCVQLLYSSLDLPPPRTLLTDKDWALMNALTAIFPGSKHLLCQWHHNENIRFKCHKRFTTLRKVDPEDLGEKEWVTFRDDWYHCLNTATEDEYNKYYKKFCDKWSPTHPKPVRYINKNWQGKWLWKLAKFGTDDAAPHFFNTTISRAEGAHALIKQELGGFSTSDLRTVIYSIRNILIRRQTAYQQRIYEGMFAERQIFLNNPLFSLVKCIISRKALALVHAQKEEMIGKVLGPCTKTYTQISGLPCKHDLAHILSNEDPRLQPAHFNHH